MRQSKLLAFALVVVLSLQGCAATKSYFRKPIDKYTYIPAAVCAVIGAGAGVGVQEARRGTSQANNLNEGTGSRSKDDPDYWKGALIGSAIGAAACALVGHAWDPPIEEPPPPVEDMPITSKIIVLRGLSFFDFDKSDIRPDSRPVLDEAAALLRQNKDINSSIEGHTDALGSDEYNQALSIRRAEAVFRFLVNRGVAPERLEVSGFGESRPVADNDTESGRAQNRRVEIHVVEETAVAPGAPETAPTAEEAEKEEAPAADGEESTEP